MISDTKKFIFIHIPKSGGTSVNSALKEYCEFPPEIEPGVRNENVTDAYKKHNTILNIKNTGINIDQYFKFAIIRNPWQRILSMYFHRIQLISREIDKQEKDFNSWMQNVFLNEKTHRYWANQIDYISIDDKISIDHIIRFENLQVGWDIVCNKLNIKCNLPHHYKTDHKPYQEYYDTVSIEAIQKMFKRDIELFDYHF